MNNECSIKTLQKPRKPWIGSKYFEIPSEERVMILGESHYTSLEEEFDPTLSIRVVRALERGVKFRFFTCVTTAITNKPYNQIDLKEFWSKHAYANFCQGGVTSGKRGASKDMFLAGARTFSDVILEARPTKILVFSRKTWDHMNPMKNFDVKGSAVIGEEKLRATTRIFTASDGSFACEALRVRHPTGWEGKSVWYPVIQEFLRRPFPVVQA